MSDTVHAVTRGPDRRWVEYYLRPLKTCYSTIELSWTVYNLLFAWILPACAGMSPHWPI